MANHLTVCYVGGNQDRLRGYCIAFDYDSDLVERLKTLIPHTHREWREDSKEWWVSDQYESVLMGLFPNFYALVYQQSKMF